jgi:general secretion pathway protein A
MLALFPRSRLATRLEEHYGLAQRPFALTLDQHFLYQSRSYAAALADVRLALDRRDGLVMVTGETGTGKTMLCRTLLDQLGASSNVSIVLDPRVTVEDLLRHVLADFGVFVAPHSQSPSRHQLMRALQRFLATLVPTGACAVVVVDEAQQLDPDVLQQLCLLLNLETNESKLLQVVLVGDTSLNDVLDRVELAQLNQRVARRCVLEPLHDEEVGSYIRHRLATAQRLALAADIHALQAGEAAIEPVPCNLSFTPAAVRGVVHHSGGIPRVVNLLCDRALEIGYQRRTHTIRALTVRAAARRVMPRRAGSSGMSGRVARHVIPGRIGRPAIPVWGVDRGRALFRSGAVAATVAVGVAGVGAGAWQAYGDGPALPAPPRAFAAAAAWSPRPETGRIEVFDRIAIWNGALSEEPKGAAPLGDPRLLGVALVRHGSVVSFALDLSAEPRRAMLHPVSDRVFELEVGPVTGPVRTEELTPASEVPLVSQLSIREQRMPPDEIFVRARVMLRAPGRADVRVAGRVIYVDIQPVGGTR